MNQLVWNINNGRYEAQVVIDGQTKTLAVDGDVLAEAIQTAEQDGMSREESENEILNPLTWYGSGLLDGAILF